MPASSLPKRWAAPQEGFVEMMNASGRSSSGLTHSHFVNPNGLPDPPGQLMSVHDLASWRAT